jgi:intein/homing endonuclease
MRKVEWMAPFHDGTFGPIPPPGQIPERTPVELPDGAETAGPVGLGHLLTHEPFDHFSITDEELDEASYVSTYGETPDQGWDDFTVAMMRASCAFFAQEVLQGPPEPPYNGKFMINDHHEEWDDLIADHNRICVLAPRDHGKCEVKQGLILSANGRRVPIAEWKSGYLLAYDPKTHQLVRTWAPASRPNGKRRTLRIRTKTGRVEEVTRNHPLRKLTSWQRADKLKVGDRIAVPYRLQLRSDCALPGAWLVGLLVGDGGLTGSNVVLSTSDLEVLAEVDDVLQGRLAWAGRTEYRLHGLQNQMRELGLMGKNAHTKRVPDDVFESNDASVAEFLSGYLDSDAHVSMHGGGSIEFYTVSEGLARDVQHLLIRLGVVSVLSIKKSRYKSELHPRGKRKAQLVELVALQEAKAVCSGSAIDRFPREVWDLVQHSEDWFRRNGYTRPTKQYEPTREKLRVIAQAEENEELLALVDADVLWDEIVEIEDAGVQETWSIHVPGFANYVSNDIINHNTFFFDFAYPIWKVFYGPRSKGFIFSSTKPQAERILMDIIEELESNPKLQWLVPEKKRIWSNSHIQLANGAHIYARGFGTRVRGGHPHWIVVDDGLNDETAYSEVVRKKQCDYFFAAISNMVPPGGQLIVVGTPFHQDDLYAHLKKNSEYKFCQYQAVRDKAGKQALWPERYSWDFLMAKQREIGSIRFQREFQCVPIADEMSLFPSYLFVGEPVEQFTLKLGMPLEYWVKHVGIVGVYTGVDFAMSASVRADYTVIWTMGVDKYGNRWLMDIQRGHGLPYQQQLSLINSVGRRYKPGLIYCEANQAQRIFGDELIRTTDLPIKLFITGAAKNTLDKGVPSLRVLFENKKIRIPRGDEKTVVLTDMWIEEMHNITFLEGKVQSVAGHDDMAMACWLCDQACRMGGFSFTFGDEDEYSTDNLSELTMDEIVGVDEPSGEGDGGGNGSTGSGNLYDDNLYEDEAGYSTSLYDDHFIIQPISAF